MKKQATTRTERLVPDLAVSNDTTVKGGATATDKPVKYMEYQLKQVLISSY